MQGNNYIVSDSDRIPSVFAAYVMFFFAMLGRELTPFLTNGVYNALSFLVPDIGQGFVSSLSSFLYYGVFVLTPFALYASRHAGMSEYIRIKPLDGKSAIKCVVIAVAGAVFVTMLTEFWVMIIEALGGKIDNGALAIPDNVAGRMGMVLTSALLPSICEELLMRGCMLSSREEKGSTKAIILTALWFMALHGSVEGMPSEFVSGLILGYVVVLTDSLFAGMIYHFVHNSFVLVMNFANVGAEISEDVSYFEQIGGVQGCISTAVGCLVLGAALYMLLKNLSKPYSDRAFGKPATEGAEKSFWVYAVACCCIAFVVIEYTLDMLAVMGVVK